MNGKRVVSDKTSLTGLIKGAIQTPTLMEEDFQEIRRLVYSHFGINLTEQKRSLVIGRLQKLLRTLGMNDFGQYLAYIKADPTGGALGELVNRISTNHTFFFREQAHFEFFKQTALPRVIKHKRDQHSRDIRIWSAGCASGEEAYTLVMLMMEHLGGDYRNWDAGVLATDISASALEAAKAGIYPEERLQKVPLSLKQKYFSKKPGEAWEVSDGLKKEVTFRRLNLMNPDFPFKKPFDMIFCRNVMIYFDRDTRNSLTEKFFSHTASDGYLFIGHSETLRQDHCPYSYVMPALYQKRTN